MTLLESLAALVILGTTAVGFLEVFHTTARVTRSASDWAEVTEYAESVMERTKLLEPEAEIVSDALRGVSTRIESRAFAPGVSEVIVVVTSTTGRTLELRRLTREPGSRPR